MNNSVVFGLDILPGFSVSSKTKQPHYALVILIGNRVANEYSDIAFTRLIRLVWEYKPSIIAIDNVFELVRDTSELARLYTILPPNTRIVQTTGWSSELLDLTTTASKYGLDISNKPSPLRTAYVSALVASLGGGFTVKLGGEKTKVVITKNRSVSQGGSSSERFKRSIRACILNATREIKKILDTNGLDYDLVYRKSRGGLDRSIFIVYASRDKLYGLIKPFKNKNIKLIIKPIYSSRVVYEETSAETSRRGIILGIDPGMSIGLAIIDLCGNPIYLESFKGIDRDEIVNIVSKYGEVVVVATDTHQPPDLVKKISSILNAELYTPPYDLPNEEKQEIVNKVVEKNSGLDIRDNHVRDALASAYKALYMLRDKLDFVDSKIREMSIELDAERIKISVIRGMSFAEALERELERYVEKLKSTLDNRAVSEKRRENSIEEKYVERIKELKSRIAYYESVINELVNQLRERDRVISDLRIELKTTNSVFDARDIYERRIYLLRNEIDSLRREVSKREEIISELNRKISELEDIVFKISSGEYIIVPRVSNLSLSEVRRVVEKADYRLIYIDEINPLDNDTINLLKNNRVAVLTSRDYGELYRELRIPIVEITEKYFFKNNIVIHKSVLNNIEKMWRIINELNTADEYRRIWRVIREYKETRKKGK